MQIATSGAEFGAGSGELQLFRRQRAGKVACTPPRGHGLVRVRQVSLQPTPPAPLHRCRS
jgi:hypothetical protein